jgi:hypothetical protein
MNDTNLLISLLCSGSYIDLLKIFGSFMFSPLMWGKLIQDYKLFDNIIFSKIISNIIQLPISFQYFTNFKISKVNKLIN